MERRACGDCRACCSVMGITELAKPPYTNCKNECDKGCAIYAERPVSCAGYQCLWLMETDPTLRAAAPTVGSFLLREEERPDKSGLIFEVSSINRSESDFEKEAGISYLTVREAKPGAFEGYWAKKVFKRLIKHTLVIMVFESGLRRAVGPPEKVRLVGEFLQRVRVVSK